jgi:D-alanyl-D-alanine carboxypeptidase
MLFIAIKLKIQYIYKTRNKRDMYIMFKPFYLVALFVVAITFCYSTNNVKSLTISSQSIEYSDNRYEHYDEEDNLTLEQLQSKQDKIAHVVIDYNSGNIIAQYKANEKWFPASITKIMTLYIVFDKLESKELSLDTPVLISKKASQQEPVKLGLKAGSYITIKDAILAMSVKSANDVAYAVGEHIGGSIQEFSKLMNEKAKSIGMLNTNFANPTGLPDKNNYSTALDLARLGRSLMIVHNPYYIVFSLKAFSWDRYNYFNHNSFLLSYEEVDGIKTGFTNASGRTSITSAQRNNARIITVALGFKTSRSRDNYIKKLTDYSLPLAKDLRNAEVSYIQKPNNVNIFNDYIVMENKELKKESKKATNVANNNYIINPTDYLYKLAYSSYVSINPFSVNNQNYNNQNQVSLNNASFIKPDIRVAKPTTVSNIKNTTNINNANNVISSSNISNNKPSTTKGKYTIQAGAFSSYKAALTAGMNILKIKTLSNTLTQKNIVIEQSSANNLYVLKFVNLNQQIATNNCNILKSKNFDCFIKI